MLELVETKQPLQAFRLWHSDWALTIAGVMIGYGIRFLTRLAIIAVL